MDKIDEWVSDSLGTKLNVYSLVLSIIVIFLYWFAPIFSLISICM